MPIHADTLASHDPCPCQGDRLCGVDEYARMIRRGNGDDEKIRQGMFVAQGLAVGR
jgi:hypothetical protein